jgi:hypothetical protein
MDMTGKTDAVANYVREHVQIERSRNESSTSPVSLERFEKILSILPEEVLDLFLSEARSLVVRVMPDPSLPLGMQTRTEGPVGRRKYIIVVYTEHFQWPEDLFIGAFLRELGHVVAQRPPESEWPTSRGDRARFKEKLECRADATVWRWGLRHYNMRYLSATYPEHWVETIIEQIGKMLLEEEG